MTDAELRKLKRSELLEILLEQAKEIERLEQENASLTNQLRDKRILIQNAGTMAEAAFALNGVFEAADAAVRQYLENIYAQAPASGVDETPTEDQQPREEQPEETTTAENEVQPMEEPGILAEQTGTMDA